MATVDDNIARVLVALIKSPLAWGVLLFALALAEGQGWIRIPVFDQLVDGLVRLVRSVIPGIASGA